LKNKNKRENIILEKWKIGIMEKWGKIMEGLKNGIMEKWAQPNIPTFHYSIILISIDLLF